MKTYAIRRERAWQTPDELGVAAESSKKVAASEFPDDIRWLRSYVIEEPDGSIGSICIYEASGPEAIRDHAGQVGMPAHQILEVGDTVVIVPEAA